MQKSNTWYVIGNGTQPNPADIDFEHAIVINDGGKRYPQARVLFFIDRKWYENNVEFVNNWHGDVLTSSSNPKRRDYPNVVCLRKNTAEVLPGKGTGKGWDSGYHAMCAAVNYYGAEKLVLAGIDMMGPHRILDDDWFIARGKDYIPLVKAIKRRGIEIVSLTPTVLEVEKPGWNSADRENHIVYIGE